MMDIKEKLRPTRKSVRNFIILVAVVIFALAVIQVLSQSYISVM